MPGAPIATLARAELRHRWLGFVLVGLLAGCVAGLAAGSLAVARRTDTSVERLAAAAGLGDALVNVYGDTTLAADVLGLDVVTAGTVVPAWVGVLDGPDRSVLSVIVPEDLGGEVFHPALVEGRLPSLDAADEVVIFETVARNFGVEIGAEFALGLLTTAQTFQFEDGFGEPAGPTVDLRVVGIVRTNGLADQLPPLVAGPAFAEAYAEDRSGEAGVAVNLDGGLSSSAALETALQALQRTATPIDGLEATEISASYPAASSTASVTSAKGLLVGGLVAFAAVVVAAGMLAVGQALQRLHQSSQNSVEVEAALGMTAIERVVARALPSTLAVIVATVLAAAGVVLAGWIEPIGALRSFEPFPGFAANVGLAAAAALTATAVIALVAVLAALPAGRRRRTPVVARPSAFTERLAALGGAPTAMIGARLAFEPPRHRQGVPLRSVRAGLVLAVGGVVALLVVGGNLARLLDEPARYGGRADFTVSDIRDEQVTELLADPRVSALSVDAVTPIEVDGRTLSATAIEHRRGEAGWTLLAGTFPATQEEVVLGSRVAEQLDRQIGDVITASFPGSPSMTLRVVGTGMGPNNEIGSLGSRLLLPMATLEQTSNDIFRNALVIVGPDEDPETVRADYSDRWETSARLVPAEVNNLEQVGGLPRALAGFLIVIGAIALANGLVVAVRRRRATIAVLRTMGFTPRQAAASILAMTGFVAVAALVIGLPLGFVLGAVVWRAIAAGATIAQDVLVPWLPLMAVGLGTVGTAILVGVLPARRAARLRPAAILREG